MFLRNSFKHLKRYPFLSNITLNSLKPKLMTTEKLNNNKLIPPQNMLDQPHVKTKKIEEESKGSSSTTTTTTTTTTSLADNIFSTSNNGIKISNLDLSDEALPRVKVSGFNRTKSVDLENFLKTFTPQWRKFKLQKNATSGTFVFNTIEGK